MFVKIFVLDADGGLFDVGGEIGDFDRVSVFVTINLVKEFAVSVEESGANGGGVFGKFVWIGDILKK